jgi:hypothetical protein
MKTWLHSSCAVPASKLMCKPLLKSLPQIGLKSHLIFYDIVNSQGHRDEDLAGVKLRGFSNAVAEGMGLPAVLPSPVETARKRPTLGLLSKSGKRKLVNENEVAAWAKEAGFDVLVLNCDMHCTKTSWKDLVREPPKLSLTTNLT